ncbi:MAG TPA: amidohydrolase family protein [Thermoanaerobaculia bacterium]
MKRTISALSALALVAMAAIHVSSSGAARGAPAGVRLGDDRAAAIVGGRVIAAPGKVFDPGVVVMRGGTLVAAGREGAVAIPADARLFDARGRVVHAAFVDPFVPADRLGGKAPRKPSDDEDTEDRATPAARPARGPADHPLTSVAAQRRALDGLTVKDRVAEAYRRMGYAVVAAVPTEGTLRGRGAVVSLSDGPLSGRVILPEAGQHVALEPERLDFSNFSQAISRAVYPVSRMGAVALIRQSFLDAAWWRDAEAAYAKGSGLSRPKYVESSAALASALAGREAVFFDTMDALALLRATKLAREFSLKAICVGGNDEYRLLAQVAAAKPDLIVRVAYPRPERMADETEWLDVPLERLRHIDRAPSNPKWLREAGLAFSLTTAGLEDPEEFPRRVREALARGLSAADALAAVTTIPARQLGLATRLGALEPGMIANVVLASGEPFDAKTKVEAIWIDGVRLDVPEKPRREDAPERPEKVWEADVRPAPARDDGPLARPKAVVVRGATVWTQGNAGILEGADLLIVDGKVSAVGRGLTAPSGAVEIDGRGRHVTPGILDAHSHTAVDGQVNEGTHNVTAEVRIQDVLDPFDVAIYRELAGGTTTANVLHGSANAIGGQNAIVKWRRGGSPDDLLVAGAPPGIKFALGENPKRSNVQTPSQRYPQTRLGVSNLIRERFLAARDYRRRWNEFQALGKDRVAIPPARDLQLEAVAEILEGKRKVHCHSYVKSEILDVMRLAEEFGFRIATLQHGLETYKVADEVARHGAGSSIFTDWWAYKLEVYDAIPYAGPLLRERGVLTSFNSDSDELARRLNMEAAKAVKYGGVPPQDALAFVTSNPARQLGIADKVGSLEPGKDGDFVVWSGDPLATSSIALETWIEGAKYFDRADDLARRASVEKERADLVAKAKKSLERPAASAPAAAPTPAPQAGGGR